MPHSLQLQRLERPGFSLDLFIPNAREVQDQHFLHPDTPFPHWTRLWPASLAMADFIVENPKLIRHKKVLELAAGVGLPGLVAARYAAAVTISDYLRDAVDCITRSAERTGLSNIHCSILDWNYLPADCNTDVLLLSDINYDPDQFDRLYQVLEKFLQAGTLILLTTPQRLMAKPFIEKLLPFCIRQYESPINYADQIVPISIFVLSINSPN